MSSYDASRLFLRRLSVAPRSEALVLPHGASLSSSSIPTRSRARLPLVSLSLSFYTSCSSSILHHLSQRPATRVFIGKFGIAKRPCWDQETLSPSQHPINPFLPSSVLFCSHRRHPQQKHPHLLFRLTNSLRISIVLEYTRHICKSCPTFVETTFGCFVIQTTQFGYYQRLMRVVSRNLELQVE